MDLMLPSHDCVHSDDDSDGKMCHLPPHLRAEREYLPSFKENQPPQKNQQNKPSCPTKENSASTLKEGFRAALHKFRESVASPGREKAVSQPAGRRAKDLIQGGLQNLLQQNQLHHATSGVASASSPSGGVVSTQKVELPDDILLRLAREVPRPSRVPYPNPTTAGSLPKIKKTEIEYPAGVGVPHRITSSPVGLSCLSARCGADL